MIKWRVNVWFDDGCLVVTIDAENDAAAERVAQAAYPHASFIGEVTPT